MKLTANTVEVAVALLNASADRHWGYDLSKTTGLRSGVLYPVLARMLESGWLQDGWEDAQDARDTKRPPRRYYEITPKGLDGLGAFVRQANSQEVLVRRVPGVIRYA